MAERENYTLSISKSGDDAVNGTTENHTYTATNSEELKQILQLAGVLPKDEYVQIQDPAADSCGCGGGCETCMGDAYDLSTDSTAYEYGDTFENPHSYSNWEQETYGQFVNNPSAKWPQVFETLTSELVAEGLTEAEAEEKILRVLDLDEHFDYGHGNPLNNQRTVSIKGMNIDRGSLRKFKQDYVQSRYADNPLSANGELTETMADKYAKFLSEQSITEVKQFSNWQLPIGATFIAGTPLPGGIQLWIIIDTDDKMIEYKEKKDKIYSVRVAHLDKEGRLKTEEITKIPGGQINRFVTGAKSKSGMYIGTLEDPYANNIDLDNLNMAPFKKLFRPGVVMNERAPDAGDTQILNSLINAVYKTKEGEFLGKPIEELYTTMKDNHFTLGTLPEFIVQLRELGYKTINVNGKQVVTKFYKPRAREFEKNLYTQGEEIKEAKELKVLGHFKSNPSTKIVAVAARDKVTGKQTSNIIIQSSAGKQVLMRSAGTDWAKIVDRLKSVNADKIAKAGGVEWTVDEVTEAGQRLDPSCWDGYKIGNPKTKISPQTGKRVNNCVKK